MKVVIKNLHVIQSLLETNPELLFEINLKKSNADKFSTVKGIAEKNNIKVNYKNDISALCKSPTVRLSLIHI